MSANAEATVTLSLIDRITGPIKRISARIAAISKSLGLTRITGAVGHLGKSLAGLGSGLASTTARLASFTALAGLGSAGAIAGLFGLSTGAAELAKEIDRLSQVAGAPAIEFQKWTYAARTVGIESDKMADILKDVGDKVGDFMQTGGGPMKDFFENIAPKVGVTKKAFQGLSSAQALQLYVSSLEKANLSQAEMTFYMEAIANDATLLLPLLRNSGKEMSRLGIEAGKAGAILGESAIELGKAFTINLDALTRRFEALKTLVGVQLLPVFNEFVVKLREMYDANVDLIRARLIEWAGKLCQVLRDLMNPASELRKSIDEVAAGFTSFIERIKPIVKWIGGPLHAALALLAIIVLGDLIAAILNVSAMFIRLAAIMLVSPFGWILAGLAAIAAAAYALYQKWDEFAAYWSGLWGRIRDAFATGFIQGITTLFMEFNPVTHIARGINAVIEYFTGVDLGAQGAAMIRSLAAGIDSILATMVDAGSRIVNALWEGLKSAWANVVSWMRGAMADLVGWLPESIQSRLGFTVEGGMSPANNSAARIGATVGEMGGRLMRSVPEGASEARVVKAVNDNGVPTSTSNVEAGTVATNTIKTQSLQIPEPIIAHQPQSIDASRRIDNLVVQGGQGTPAEITAAVRKALEEHSQRHAAIISSSLSASGAVTH